jgi:hypothetical protein
VGLCAGVLITATMSACGGRPVARVLPQRLDRVTVTAVQIRIVNNTGASVSGVRPAQAAGVVLVATGAEILLRRRSPAQ